MEITVEISMYPLREKFEPVIIELIQEVKAVKGVEVKVNPTATHLFGEYELVMNTLQTQIRGSFDKYGKVVFAIKVLNGNLKDSLEGKNL